MMRPPHLVEGENKEMLNNKTKIRTKPTLVEGGQNVTGTHRQELLVALE